MRPATTLNVPGKGRIVGHSGPLDLPESAVNDIELRVADALGTRDLKHGCPRSDDYPMLGDDEIVRWPDGFVTCPTCGRHVEPRPSYCRGGYGFRFPWHTAPDGADVH